MTIDGAITVSVSSLEYFEPVPAFRWFAEREGLTPRLQQLSRSNLGNARWSDVPIIIGAAETN
jgi:hypothetical protein